MLVFFLLALIFASIYYSWGAVDFYKYNNRLSPGIISNLFVLDQVKGPNTYKVMSNRVVVQQNKDLIEIPPNLVPVRAIFFSVTTMATLGFGYVYANTDTFLKGFFGHVFLGTQVVIGYVILGALATRFAILFSAGGPAGRFVPMDKKTKQLLTKLREERYGGYYGKHI